jgi:hypothetical protein
MIIKTKKLQNKGKKMRITNKKVMKGGGNRNAIALNKVTGLPINPEELARQKAAIKNAISARSSVRVNITAQIKKQEAAALKLKTSKVSQPPQKRKWWKRW